jgi:hypothetical protein
MGGRVLERHKRLVRLLARQRCGAQRARRVQPAARHMAMRCHPRQSAFPCGTLHRLLIHLQAGTDGFARVGGEGAPAVGA